MGKKLKWLLDNIPEMIAGFCLITAVLITAINASSRYIMGYTFPGTDDVIAILFSWSLFIGTVAAYKRGKHFGIDMVVTRLPEGIRKYVYLFTMVIQIAALAVLTYLAWELTAKVGDRVMVALGISYIYMDIGFLLGIFLVFVYTIIDFVKMLKSLRNH